MAKAEWFFDCRNAAEIGRYFMYHFKNPVTQKI